MPVGGCGVAVAAEAPPPVRPSGYKRSCFVRVCIVGSKSSKGAAPGVQSCAGNGGNKIRLSIVSPPTLFITARHIG